MSFGKSKSKSTQQQTSTEELDPEIKAWLTNNAAQAQNAAGRLTSYTGERVAGFNDAQRQAQHTLVNLGQGQVGSSLLDQATGMASAAGGYKPFTITSSGYRPIAAGATLATAAQADRGVVRNVESGPVGADAINAYRNPWDDQVVQTSLADLERQRRIEQVNNAGAATKAGAFGGTGAAVLASLTNDNFTRQSASTAANLRQQGFNTALAAAQTDAGRRLAADQGNQNADLAVTTTNAGLANTVNLANANARQQADQFNATNWNEADRFNTGQDFAAQQANQQAGLAASQQSLTAAGLLGQFSDQRRNQAVADAGLLGQVGDMRQAQAQREIDAAYQAINDQNTLIERQQNLRNQSLGLLGNPTLTQSQGTSSSRSTDTKISLYS